MENATRQMICRSNTRLIRALLGYGRAEEAGTVVVRQDGVAGDRYLFSPGGFFVVKSGQDCRSVGQYRLGDHDMRAVHR